MRWLKGVEERGRYRARGRGGLASRERLPTKLAISSENAAFCCAPIHSPIPLHLTHNAQPPPMLRSLASAARASTRASARRAALW